LTEMRIRFSGNPSTTPDADPLLGRFRVWDLTYIQLHIYKIIFLSAHSNS
jgi:hypothetical protein